ncbi:hypothetical protein FQN54_007551 [Arachnomyces sp. PD_36]|nr:hypothetical protein FQN54_007551 [Arachnomyces sp. PD_36]
MSSMEERPPDPIESGDRLLDGEDATPAYEEVEEATLKSKSSWYLFILTLSIGGLQIVWSVELSHGSPYLLSLGMSKSLMAFVWIAGPLTGTLVQPYIGIRSDNCRICWGKRKPFMIVGGAATVISLLALAWAREIVGGFLGIFGVSPTSEGTKITAIVLATILMYCLDFAINTVQAGIRAFIVDNAPAHQQESANAWASRITGVGNILGYISGYLDLPKYLPFLGNTQFKVLCAIASLSLAVTLLISCLYIKERDPRLEGPPSAENPGLISFFSRIFKSIRRLPPQISKVCEVQICAWIGWFPFLFYSTTYIGQLYVNPIFEDHPNLPEKDIDTAWEDATRVGTFALLIFAITSFAANILLPLVVVPTYKEAVPTGRASRANSELHSPQSRRRSSTPPISPISQSSPLLTPDDKPVEVSEKPTLLTKLQIPGLTLRRTWLISHILFALCMFSTFFISTPQAGTVVIALIGISWALTLWAPFALISAEVAQRDAEYLRQKHQEWQRSGSTPSLAEAGSLDLEHGDSNNSEDGGKGSEEVDQAGVILGIHNVAVSFPQIIATLISSAIFQALQKQRGEAGDDSVGWVLRFGGLAALGAAFLTKRLAEGPGGR